MQQHEMAPERWQLISDVFLEAAAFAPSERGAFVARRCGDDVSLRREVESLLVYRREADEVDDGESGPWTADEPLDFTTWLGRRLGRYVLKRWISVGGMGVVFLAEQDEPRREVAIKVLHRGMLFGNARRRFEFEAQILGRLRHPCIAEIYEAGRAALIPPPENGPAASMHFFAMESVEGGATLTDYARANRLSTRDRLRLFIRVCDGVHHGHQKGVIHRDLKPANVLVTTEETAGDETMAAPKIIDFGVAKCTDGDVALTTMQTTAGDLIGTLQYMSPEQCAADVLEIDTRTDVYALGMILYELLTDRLPYDVSNRSIHSAMRMITDSPPAPVSRFDRHLRGDLEAIVSRALEKDRDRRYGSAAELAGDIRRYLDGVPIEARAPSAWRRASRWIGNHPALTSGLLSVLLAILIIGSTFITAWELSRMPAQIFMTPNRRRVDLLARNGGVLHSWTTTGSDGFRNATFTRSPNGAQYVVIGELSDDRNPYPGHLVVYDASRPDVVAWKDRPKHDEIPQSLLARNRDERQLSIRDLWLVDVFPEIPGDEIIAEYTMGAWSQSCLRIFSLTDGRILYEIWQDGGIFDICYLKESGLLLLALTDEYKHWADYGILDVNKLKVFAIAAIQPSLGFRSNAYINPELGIHSCVQWWKYVVPNDLYRPSLRIAVKTPTYGLDSIRFARVDVNLRQGTDEFGVFWDIDAQGNEVASSKHVNDWYRNDQKRAHPKMPSPDSVRLVDDVGQWLKEKRESKQQLQSGGNEE